MNKFLFRWLLLFFCCWLSVNVTAQKRFHDPVFPQVDSVLAIPYGSAVNVKGNQETLVLNVFKPAGNDTMQNRPLLIFIHGGGFQNGSRTGAYGSRICNRFAQLGYVVASIDYRLGIANKKSNADYAEALYRAQQDGKAAVRFFRKYAQEYGIDTAQIFITGSSAGAKTCLAMAYMRKEDVPATIDTTQWGSLEGNSGNAGYSSRVRGVINAWGAMIDYRWIRFGDAPLFNVAGTADKTVPYDSSYEYHGFKYGPYILYQYCLQTGVATGWRPFYGAGHTLDNNAGKQDSALTEMSAWLYTQLRYINPNGKKSDPTMRWAVEMKNFDSVNLVDTYPANAVLFTGSSYIRLWKNIRKDVKYPSIIHRGYGGSNLTEMAYYVKRIVYPHQPAALFMYVGNDITGSEKDKTPTQVLELFKYVVKTIRDKYPELPIVWLQIAPSPKRWMVWNEVQEANSLIAAYCAGENRLYSVNSSARYLGKDGKPMENLFVDDRLHYNEKGYQLWGKEIKKLVHQLASGRMP